MNSEQLANGSGRLSDLAGRIFAAQHQTAAAMIATGRNLSLGRRLLRSARDFDEWIAQWGWTAETAEQIAHVAECWGAAELSDVVDLIAPGAMLVLAPPFARPAAAAAIAEARKGHRVSYARAVELLDQHSPQPTRE